MPFNSTIESQFFTFVCIVCYMVTIGLLLNINFTITSKLFIHTQRVQFKMYNVTFTYYLNQNKFTKIQ